MRWSILGINELYLPPVFSSSQINMIYKISIKLSSRHTSINIPKPKYINNNTKFIKKKIKNNN